MAEVCVVYVSEDEAVVEKLVEQLGQRWSVWWAREIDHGGWEQVVRKQIRESLAVVAVLSGHAQEERLDVIRDEMRYARRVRKALLPFLIGPVEVPFGFDGQNRTEAFGYTGHPVHEGYRELERKLARTIGGIDSGGAVVPRPSSMVIRGKTLRLPAFAFSLSSHETQVTPGEGLELLHLLEPEALLVSAYDAWKYHRQDRAFRASVRMVRDSDEVLILDSGNYESWRKGDRYAKRRNPGGWRRSEFYATALRHSPDLAFSFDAVAPTGTCAQVAASIVRSFNQDDRALRVRDFPLCPIVHLPKGGKITVADAASETVSKVASKLDPLMIAVPERELGDGLLQRARTVRAIRQALDSLGRYYPLHLLGTGNPLSMIALAAAGADSFDGLEWCRTIADYEHGFLFHFHHFDCFKDVQRYRIEDAKVRRIMDDSTVSYTARALSYNVDYFKSAIRTIQSMIHAGQVKTLLNEIPNIGALLFKELTQ